MNIDQLQLCYITGKSHSGGYAYFTENMKSVRGDDWDDAPYWDNASEPYSDEPIVIVGFIAHSLWTQEDAYHYVSIDGLLNKECPCLFLKEEGLFFGETLRTFCDFVRRNNGEVFLPLSQPEILHALITTNSSPIEK